MKWQGNSNAPIECLPVGGMDVGGQQNSQKGACVEQFVPESIITLWECSKEMVVNKPSFPSNAAECLFLLFLSKFSATAEQRHQGGISVFC